MSSQSHQHYLQAFNKLDTVLHQQQLLWKPRPFQHRQIPWQANHPELHQALLALSDQTIEHLSHHNEERLKFFSQFLATTCQQLDHFKPPPINTQKPELSSFQTVGIPGRKLAQINAFAGAVTKPNSDIVDWCCGKGHLSRVLYWHHQQPVHCLEFDQALCNSGQALAQKHQTPLTFYHHDVLEPLPEQLGQQSLCHVGLHACGQLHIQLLKTAAQAKHSPPAQQIALSPCCYHKIPHSHYQPLSSAATKAKLILNRDDLHLPQEQLVTGGQRIENLRNKEQLWRLAFDEYRGDHSGDQQYQPLSSFKKTLLNGSLSDFCLWAAKQQHLASNTPVDEHHYLERAAQRLKQVRQLELVRQLFQRPLELWLALDRVLYLAEQGYHAQLHEFCPQHISPRNLLITAQLKN